MQSYLQIALCLNFYIIKLMRKINFFSTILKRCILAKGGGVSRTPRSVLSFAAGTIRLSFIRLTELEPSIYSMMFNNVQ